MRAPILAILVTQAPACHMGRGMYPAAAAEEMAAGHIVTKALATLKSMGIDGAGTILSGMPARAIVDAASSNHVSLIVMGHRHLSWVDRLLHPSICWDVLERAHCPVLVNVDDKA